MRKKQNSTRNIILTGMFAAVLAALSQLQIPMPSGVPVTLQTFAAALGGFMLGARGGAMTVLVYVLAGAVGLPVFSGFQGGMGVILGPAGGFLWGFFALAALCGYGFERKSLVRTVFAVIGLAVCHLIGIAQFMAVMKTGFIEAALLASVPYLIKDTLSVAGAYLAARSVRRSLSCAGYIL